MKLSNLINILEKIKEKNGDLHIWNIDCFSWNMPDELTIELAKEFEKTEFGSKCKETIETKILLDYSGIKLTGVEIVDL